MRLHSFVNSALLRRGLFAPAPATTLQVSRNGTFLSAAFLRRRSMLLRMLVVAIAVLSASPAAHADSFSIFTLQSTYEQSGGTITGSITLDTSTHLFSAIDLTASNFSVADGTTTTIADQEELVPGVYILSANIGTATLDLLLPITSLAGYNGSDICTDITTCSNFGTYYEASTQDFWAKTGSLSLAAATPEPSSLALLGTGLLGVAGVVKRRPA